MRIVWVEIPLNSLIGSRLRSLFFSNKVLVVDSVPGLWPSVHGHQPRQLPHAHLSAEVYRPLPVLSPPCCSSTGTVRDPGVVCPHLKGFNLKEMTFHQQGTLYDDMSLEYFEEILKVWGKQVNEDIWSGEGGLVVGQEEIQCQCSVLAVPGPSLDAWPPDRA